MIILDDIRRQLLALKPLVIELGAALEIEKQKQKLQTLEEQQLAPDFWQNQTKQAQVFAQVREAKLKIDNFGELYSAFEDAQAFFDMLSEEEQAGEAELVEMQQIADDVQKKYDNLRLLTLLSGEYDTNNAVLTFHAGAGGTEAQDWAEMLYRMYTRHAANRGFKVKVLDYLDGDEAGLKSASILIEGTNAYGLLKGEAGVHRLVRISPFDSSGRRHTSFASLEVIPEISDDIDLKIDEEDLRVDTYRSGGAGGQHVNKTESAIRITHIPSGVVVACQNERSQHQNREVAMKMLKSILLQIKEREHLERIEDIKGVQKDIAWGSQIRSYVFMPYTLVKDHRTGFEIGNVNAVMDGELDGFINAYLSAAAKGELK